MLLTGFKYFTNACTEVKQDWWMILIIIIYSQNLSEIQALTTKPRTWLGSKTLF